MSIIQQHFRFEGAANSRLLSRSNNHLNTCAISIEPAAVGEDHKEALAIIASPMALLPMSVETGLTLDDSSKKAARSTPSHRHRPYDLGLDQVTQFLDQHPDFVEDYVLNNVDLVSLERWTVRKARMENGFSDIDAGKFEILQQPSKPAA